MEARVFTDQESVFNQYVASHPRGDVLQTTHWGRLKQCTGWSYLPLAMLSHGQIRASALILKRSLPITGRCLFYSPRGPLFSSGEALKELLVAGRELGRQERAILWKMDPPLVPGDDQFVAISERLTQVNTGLDFDGVQPKFIMELDIRPPLEQVLATMKAKTRYNIRYAHRKQVKVYGTKDKENLPEFYNLLQETAIRDGFTVRSYAYFEHLWDCLVTNNLAQLFIAHHHGEMLSGAIAFRLGRRAWYVYGASSTKKRSLQPNYALQWEMIRWAKGCGCQVYDFRGVSGELDPKHPLYGLYRFKEGFGAHIVEYVGEYDLVWAPVWYHLWRSLVPLYSRVRQPRS